MNEGAFAEIDAHAAVERLLRLRDDSLRRRGGGSPPAGEGPSDGGGGDGGGETVERPTTQTGAKLPTGAGLGGAIVDQPSTGGQTGIKKGFTGSGGSGVFGGLGSVGPGGATSAAGQALIGGGGGGGGGGGEQGSFAGGGGPTRERGVEGSGLSSQPREGFETVPRDGGGGGGGSHNKLGRGRSGHLEFIDDYEDGAPDQKQPECFWEPDLWRRDDLRKINQPARPSSAAVIVNAQVILDVSHAFQPGPSGDTADTPPHLWNAANRSNRWVDQKDEETNDDFDRAEALGPSGLFCLDDLSGFYAVAHVIGERIAGPGGSIADDALEAPEDPAFSGASTYTVERGVHSQVDEAEGAAGGGTLLDAGYNFDGKRGGRWATLLVNNPLDKIGTGRRRGTEITLTGILRNAHHIEWNDKHGPLHSRRIECTGIEGSGTRVKGWLAHDASVKGYGGGDPPGSGEWRPEIALPFIVPPVDKPQDANPPEPNPDGTRDPTGGLPEDATTNNGTTDGLPATQEGFEGDQFVVYTDKRCGIRIADREDYANSACWGYAIRIGTCCPDTEPGGTGNADERLAGGCIGDFTVVTRRGPNDNKSVPYISQGDGATTPGRGFVLPGVVDLNDRPTFVGVDGADSPSLYFGEETQTPFWREGIDAVDGNFKVVPLNAGGASIAQGFQVEIQTALDISGEDGFAFTRSWSFNPSTTKAYALFPINATAPTDVFPAQFFTIDDATGHKLCHRDLGSALDCVLLHTDATRPEYNAVTLTEVTAASVPLPPAGKKSLFIDIADNHLKRKDPAGVVTDIEGGGGGGSAAESAFSRVGAARTFI